MLYVEHADRYSNRMMDLPTYLLRQQRAVFITDTITDSLATEVLQQLMYLASVSSEDIILYINSPGGSVTAGLAIYDAICGIPCDVSTVCFGLAASMAAVLLSAGTAGKRFLLPNSEVMIHQVMGGAQGQAVDVEIAAAQIGRTKSRLNYLLSKHTGQPLERIRSDSDRDFFLNASEAVQYGLADAVREQIM